MTRGLGFFFFFFLKDEVKLYLLRAIPSAGSSVEQWCSGNEVIVCVRGDKGHFNLAPFTPMRWGPNHFKKFFFLHNYFLFVSYRPESVSAGTDRVDFTPASGHFQSQHIPDQLHFVFFFPFFFSFFWPCNLSLFWSSVVPTQEWSAQRKKLMKSSFPLKCGSWVSPVSTLSGLVGVSEFHTVTTGRVHKD